MLLAIPKVTPQTTNTKVVWAMKKLQAWYNDHANKIVKQAMQEKSAIENLIFSFIWLWWPLTPRLYLKNPRSSPKPGTIPVQVLPWNGKKQSKMNSPTRTSNRYGARQVKVLYPLIVCVWRTSGSLRLSETVCTSHVSSHVGAVRYPVLIFQRIILQ